MAGARLLRKPYGNAVWKKLDRAAKKDDSDLKSFVD